MKEEKEDKSDEVIRPLNYLRCGHKWIPRAFELPERCPKCNSPYWNKERKRGKR